MGGAKGEMARIFVRVSRFSSRTVQSFFFLNVSVSRKEGQRARSQATTNICEYQTIRDCAPRDKILTGVKVVSLNRITSIYYKPYKIFVESISRNFSTISSFYLLVAKDARQYNTRGGVTSKFIVLSLSLSLPLSLKHDMILRFADDGTLLSNFFFFYTKIERLRSQVR